MTNFINFNMKNLTGGFNTSNYLPNMNFLGGGSSMTSNSILYIIFIIVLITLAIYLGHAFVMPFFKTKFIANNELETGSTSSGSTGEAELLFFYADWCPHCKTAKPVWEDLVNEYENKTINGYSVTFTEVNCTTENAKVEEMMNKYKIEGFPTFKLIKDGQVIEFDAKPSKDNLTQFLNTVL